jgi:PPOX class probable FMN-dependent enzyme
MRLTGSREANNQMATTTFRQIVKNEEELREILGHPTELSLGKEIYALDEHCRNFIARSPFLLIGTANADGKGDVSPKGDPAGFVQVLDDHTLVIPDRPGNRRADSLVNLLENPQIGLLFMVPGVEETLRINGTATIVRDEELLGRMKVNGKQPLLGIVVEVREAFLHCAKAFKRSHLWEAESQIERSELPSLAEMVLDHTNGDVCTLEEMEEYIEDSNRNRLY